MAAVATAAGSDASHVTGRRESTWDDILTMDIISVLVAAGQDIAAKAGEVADDFKHDIERVKAAFNCQEPERATLSAERIAVEHAVAEAEAQVGSLFASCSAPQFDPDEVVIDDTRHEPGEDTVVCKPKKNKKRKEQEDEKSEVADNAEEEAPKKDEEAQARQTEGSQDSPRSVVCEAAAGQAETAPVVADLLDFDAECAVASAPATTGAAASSNQSTVKDLIDLTDAGSNVSFVAEEAAEREKAAQEVRQEQEVLLSVFSPGYAEALPQGQVSRPSPHPDLVCRHREAAAAAVVAAPAQPAPVADLLDLS
eukprot:TRINITY_DN14462_c0_g1_i2.p1 TRINITY_DN14462_c0_g1~~TRINITY_DN14462_c0_g1_i2.p1  ORF type:complete len:311 (-),score=93.08 TRINITY_DN14462_c0_g1_i2:170-1102(-)